MAPSARATPKSTRSSLTDEPSKMPAKNLFARIVEKADGRVVRMDGDATADTDLAKPGVKAKWKKAGITVKEDPLFYDFTITDAA